MKKSLSILLILVVMLFAVPVHAKENNFYADENVSVEGNQDGSVFAAGYIVKSESVIDGLGFFAGNKVTIKSTQDHLFAAGYDVVLNGIKTKDAFVAGNTIEIEDCAFSDLEALTSVTIPKSVKNIGYFNFTSCRQLKCIKISKDSPIKKDIEERLLLPDDAKIEEF